MKNRSRRVLVGVLSTAALVLAAQGSIGRAEVSARSIDMSQLDEMEISWGEQFGLSIEDTYAVFDQTDEINAFQTKYSGDQRFGAIWPTYDNGYQVHVRYLDPSFEEAIPALESQIGRRVVRTQGGLSFQDLTAAQQVLFSGVERPGLVNINFQDGTVDVDANWDRGIAGIDDAAIRRTMFPPEDPFVESNPEMGDDANNAAGSCTAGAMFKEPTARRGFITAGHCPNTGFGVWDGSTNFPQSTTRATQEYCTATRDVQFVYFNDSTNLGEWWRHKPGGGTTPFAGGIAGGFNALQPTYKVGHALNGTTGSNAGVVVGWLDSDVDELGDNYSCWSGAHHGTRLVTQNAGELGDSGGPILVSFNGSWYWAGTTVLTNSQFTISQWAQHTTGVMTPYGVELCSTTVTC